MWWFNIPLLAYESQKLETTSKEPSNSQAGLAQYPVIGSPYPSLDQTVTPTQVTRSVVRATHGELSLPVATRSQRRLER